MENETKTVPQPVVHLNGSGYESLKEQYETACIALEEAIKKLPCPHGRDYYPLGDDAYAPARAQFQAQAKALREVLAQVETTFHHVYSQGRK